MPESAAWIAADRLIVVALDRLEALSLDMRAFRDEDDRNTFEAGKEETKDGWPTLRLTSLGSLALGRAMRSAVDAARSVRDLKYDSGSIPEGWNHAIDRCARVTFVLVPALDTLERWSEDVDTGFFSEGEILLELVDLVKETHEALAQAYSEHSPFPKKTADISSEISEDSRSGAAAEEETAPPAPELYTLPQVLEIVRGHAEALRNAAEALEAVEGRDAGILALVGERARQAATAFWDIENDQSSMTDSELGEVWRSGGREFELVYRAMWALPSLELAVQAAASESCEIAATSPWLCCSVGAKDIAKDLTEWVRAQEKEVAHD